MHLQGAGPLWLEVGKLAMQAGDRLQNSPLLNPLVRAQMQEGIARAQAGSAIVAHAMRNKKWLYATGSESPQGASLVAPITQPVTQQAASDIDITGGGDGGTPPSKEISPQPSTITRTGKNTGVDTDGNPYYEKTPGSNQWTAGKPPPLPPSNLNVGMAQGGLVHPRLFAANGGLVPSRNQPPDAPTGPQGAPTGTFLNPATGSYQPLQAQQPVIDPRQAAVQEAAARQAAAQQAQAAKEQQFAQWQQQNAQPIASAQEALAWAKNYHTGYTAATFLPHAGPGGEPAFSFRDKAGASSVVPISQMVRNGFAPAMAAGNLSPALGVAEQIQQQGQGTQGPGLPMGPVSPAQQPGQQGNQVAQVQLPTGQVWNPQQPGPGPLAPPAPGAYNAAAYQMPQGPTVTQTGAVNPALMAGGSDEQALAAARAATDPTAAQMEADAKSAHPIYQWQTSEKGQRFADLPDDAAHPFLHRRFWLGSTGFVGGQGSPEEWRKQQLFDNLAGPTGIPLPKGIGRMDYDTINNMDADTQQKWLDYIRDYTLHKDAPLATSAEGQGLTDASNAIKAAQRIKDKILYLKQNNIPMDAVSQSELIRSKEAGWAAAANEPLERGFWGGAAQGLPKNNFADQLGQDYTMLNAHLAKVPGGTYPNAATPKQEELGLNLRPWVDVDIGMPRTTNVSTIEALNKIGSGDTHDEALAHIQEVLDNATADYKKQIAKLPKAGWRVPDEDQINQSDLLDPKKGYIEDRTNKMRDKDGNLVNGYGKIQLPFGSQTSGALPTPGTTIAPPTASEAREGLRRVGALPSDTGAQAHVANSMDDVRKIMGLKPSGTHFHYKGQEYMVP